MMQSQLPKYLGSVFALLVFIGCATPSGTIYLPIFDKEEAEKIYPSIKGIIVMANELKGPIGEIWIGDDSIIIKTGVRLKIIIKAGDEIVKENTYVVPPDGSLYLPYVSKINVEGKSVGGVKTELEEKLGKVLREPKVLISVSGKRDCVVEIYGKTLRPGTYNLSDIASQTLFVLLTKAGMDRGANVTQIMVIRKNSVKKGIPNLIICNWYRFYANDDFDQNIALQNDDIVVIPKLYGEEQNLPDELRWIAQYIEGKISRSELIHRIQ
jgi:polysaccharide export outer membrane protein